MICKKCKKEIEDDSVYCRFCGKKQIETERPKALKRANGTGTVYKLSERRRKPYRALATLNGKQVLIGDFERKADALLALEKIISEGGLPEFYGITVAEAREHWMSKHYPRLSKSGVENYNTAWNYFDDKIRKAKLADIKTHHLQKIVDSAVEQGKSRSICEKIKQLASQICQWGMQNDIIDKNYASFIEIRSIDQKAREPFTVEELTRIWHYYNNADTEDLTSGVILLLCHTGLRVDELLSMKKEDYYNGCLHGGSKTKKGMGRSVPVPDVMLPIVEELMDQDGEYIVSNTQGGKFDAKNWRERRYYVTLRNVGFSEDLIRRRTPHSCRHTYATLCARSDMDDKALQDILGHEDISTTKNIYAHTDEEYLKSVAKHLRFIDVAESTVSVKKGGTA